MRAALRSRVSSDLGMFVSMMTDFESPVQCGPGVAQECSLWGTLQPGHFMTLLDSSAISAVFTCFDAILIL